MSLTRVKDGLSAIAAEVLEDVRKEAEALILQAESEAKEALRNAKDEADKAYEVTMKDATAKVEAEKRRIQSLTEVEARNSLLQTKDALIDAAFEKANERLEGFTKTEAYHNYLLDFIFEAARKVKSKNLVVYVNASDKSWLEQTSLVDLSKKLGADLKLADETESCVGGCKIQTADGKIIYDNTIENRLMQLKPELRLKTAKILFAQEENKNAS